MEKPRANLHTAEIERGEDGIIYVRIRPQVVQSQVDAQVNLAAAIAFAGDTPKPLLLDLRQTEPLKPEVRQCYKGSKVEAHFAALAILVGMSDVKRALANIYLSVAGLKIPTQIFSDEPSAKAWLSKKSQIGAAESH